MTNPILSDITKAEQFHATGNLEMAAELYRKVLTHSPGLSRTAYNLGMILIEQQEYPGAEAAFRQSLTNEPDLFEARFNLAFALQEQGKITEALAELAQLSVLRPDSPDVQFNLACLDLLLGKLPQGWGGYEQRFHTMSPVAERHLYIPLWNGAIHPGLRLLIVVEQGYGDAIQMARYIPQLHSEGVQVHLEVTAPLLSLFSRINCASCMVRGSTLPEVDYRIPIMSLPRLFKTALESIPAEIPYLTLDPELVRHWQHQLPDTGMLKVGLCWAGRLDLPVNRKRSCPTKFLKPLFSCPGTKFISLQKDAPAGFACNDIRLHEFTEKLTDFHQTAAVISNLDLVITIDTAIAHLAGALGIPTWLMLPAVPDWRWMLERSYSPWYPTMRLFRQPAPGDWQSVTDSVSAALTQFQAAPQPSHKKSAPATAWYRLGNRLLSKQESAQAVDCYRQALAQEPLMGLAWHNLGLACQRLNRFDEALVYYRRALQCIPDDRCTLNNLGVLHREKGQLEASLHTFDRLLKLHPEDGDAHWNRALTLLTARQYEEGWQEYEWRFKRSQPITVYDPGTPRWQGEPLAGKTILLCCEQAYGDSIQFIRFASLLADWGATVLVRCPDKSLAGLLAHAPGVSQTITPDQPIPSYNYWSPLLSLPLYLGKTAYPLPPCPYLLLPETSVIKLSTDHRLKVGLVWFGRRTDPRRSCPASAFTTLAALRTQIVFFSLQLGAPEEDLLLLQKQLGLQDLAPNLLDFSATARIMQQLDLIISIDSAPAHLAGALGLPCWLLASSTPDWRWGLTGEQTNWYPSIRIFRENTESGWVAPLAEMAKALRQRLSKSCATTSRITPDCLLELGDQLREEERWSHALHYYQQAASMTPNDHLPLLRSGGCLMFLNRFKEALEQFRKAIALKPQLAEAHINLGLACLVTGNFTEGWKEFEWRRTGINVTLPPWPELPLLKVDADLSGSSVLVHAEQGFGDLFQFARYLPLLAEVGLQVIVTVPQSVVGIFRRIKGVTQVIPHGELLPKMDYQTLMLSLPHLLQERHPGIPCPDRYLEAATEKVAEWRYHFTDSADLKVGLVWCGREMNKSGYRRSLAPEQLKPLSRLPGVALYSLQIDPPPNLEQIIPGVVDLGSHVRDFDDTAAIIANLDLLITVDTSLAHLAGALGCTTWVALLFATDWRWNTDQQGNSLWYLSLYLFRQPYPGAWEPVIERMASLLEGELLIRKGHALGRAGKRGDAIALFRKASELPEKSAAALLNLGIYLRAEGYTDEAATALQQAVDIEPDYPEAWQNLGLALQDLGQLDEAWHAFNKSLALRPNYPTARWNLGLLQLLTGEYREGFRNFEYRFSKLGAVARRHTDIPAWDGSSLVDRAILVHAEQGYGDTIQFVRFLQPLAEMGATIILEVQDPSLATLCLTAPGVTQVIVRGEPLPKVDCQIPLLSLPLLFKNTLDSISRKVPYLFADKNKVTAWQQRLPRDGRPRIGICWKGRSTPDPRRSVPFAEINPLLAIPDRCWVSLQIDKDTEATLPEHLLDFTASIGDFADSAALISCLDLVITIDSAVAHLAGALGKPGIVLLSFAPDWRWTLDQPCTPWYPTLQLVRQQQQGEWKRAIAAIGNP